MRKISLIILREYLTRVKKKSFIVTTLLVPLAMVIFFASMIYISKFSNEEQFIIALDESHTFENRIPDTETLYVKFSDSSLTYLKENYDQMGYDALLYIPPIDIQRPTGIKLYSRQNIGLQAKSHLEKHLEKKIERLKLKGAGIDESVLKDLKVNIDIQTIINKGEEEQDSNTGIATVIGMIMGFIIYMVLIIYGTVVMKGVMEEKTNRIVEIMMSSVKPFQLMIGKVIGLAAVGLTQFILWGILITLLQFAMGIYMGQEILEMQQMAATQQVNGQPDMDEVLLLMNNIQNINFLQLGSTFIFFFIGGYFLYASLFAAVGSLIDEQSDQQSFVFPITMPIIISIFIMMTISQNPNSDLIVWASIIPLSSPIVMPARIPFGVPGWQLAISCIMLVLGFLAAIWVAGKIYRTGILLYGKKVTFKEVGRWIFYKG